MLKLASFTDEISQDPARAVEVCKEFGLDGIELRSAWEKPPQTLTDDDVARIRHLADAAGLATACIASPFFKCDLGDEAAYEQHLAILRRCIKIGRMLGTSIVRGFTFWRTENPDEALTRRIADLFAEPVRILEGEGAILGIENEFSCHIGSATELRAFLDTLGAPCVKAIWDPSNQVYMPDDTPLPFPEGYELMRRDIVHMHMKDSVRLPGGERAHVPVGDGQVGWPAHFAALKADGYDGYCSLETHWRPSKELTEEIMSRPGGSQYTEGAEAGSRVCLESIKRMLGEMV